MSDAPQQALQDARERFGVVEAAANRFIYVSHND